VVPAVTAAGNPVTVRTEPGDEVIALDPFSALPSGVVYLMHTHVARALGGWPERYRVAMSEDLELCFTCWCNGLDVILDTRTLIQHELHATLGAKIADQHALWRENLDRFLEFWTTTDGDGVPRLPSTDPDAFQENIGHARAAATWLARLDQVRTDKEDVIRTLRSRLRAQRQRERERQSRQRARLRGLIGAGLRRVVG
jgi:hypothetical protein